MGRPGTSSHFYLAHGYRNAGGAHVYLSVRLDHSAKRADGFRESECRDPFVYNRDRPR